MSDMLRICSWYLSKIKDKHLNSKIHKCILVAQYPISVPVIYIIVRSISTIVSYMVHYPPQNVSSSFSKELSFIIRTKNLKPQKPVINSKARYDFYHPPQEFLSSSLICLSSFARQMLRAIFSSRTFL